MCGAVETVDDDGPADADLVAEQARVGELVVECAMRSDELTGMRFTCVDEVPRDIWVPVGRGVEQRTLC